MTPAIPDKTVNQMARLAVTGYLDSALEVLHKLDLPSSLREKVQCILQNPNGDLLPERHENIKNRVIEVLTAPALPLSAPNPVIAKKAGSFNLCPHFNRAKKQNLVFKGTNICQVRPPKADLFSDKIMPQDLIKLIFSTCIANGTSNTLMCLNRAWNREGNECQKSFLSMFEQYIKNGTLTIIDAKAMGFEVDDEPPFDRVNIAYHCQRLAPHISGGKGLTLVTIPKGISVRDYVMETRNLSFTYGGLTFFSNVITQKEEEESVYAVAENCSYRALITNNVFSQTLKFSTDEDMALFAEELSCEVPKIQEHFFQLNATRLVFNRSIFTDFCGCCSNGNEDRDNVTFGVYGLPIEERGILQFCKLKSNCIDVDVGSGGVIRFKGKNEAPK